MKSIETKKYPFPFVGYRCISDCVLDSTRFDDGEEIIISNNCTDSDWKGTDFFDNHPYEFEPIPVEQVFSVIGNGEEKFYVFVDGEKAARQKCINDDHSWDNFEEWCEMELTHVYEYEF